MSAGGNGCYLVLEGPDGCGKSSQAERLVAALEEDGRKVLHLREPGSTPVGEGLRKILLDPSSGEMSPWTEVLMFSAARLEMLRAEVAPTLAAGGVVVAERCYLSTMVYQGLAVAQGRAVPMQEIQDLTNMVHDQAGVSRPHLVVVLDLPWEAASQRMGGRQKDRIEAHGQQHWEQVRDGYVSLGNGRPECMLFDASGTIDDVALGLMALLRPLVQERCGSR